MNTASAPRKTREEVQAEVAEINKMKKETRSDVLPCRECHGKGYSTHYLFGDPVLGGWQEKCFYCNGTGTRLKFKEKT